MVDYSMSVWVGGWQAIRRVLAMARLAGSRLVCGGYVVADVSTCQKWQVSESSSVTPCVLCVCE